MHDASNMIPNKKHKCKPTLYIYIFYQRFRPPHLKKKNRYRFFLLLFPISGFTGLKLMHFHLLKLQNLICISVHWLSFHRFGKTQE